jgi:hypothetical protein
LRGKADWVKFDEYGRGVEDDTLIKVFHILVPEVIVLDLWNLSLEIGADALI